MSENQTTFFYLVFRGNAGLPDPVVVWTEEEAKASLLDFAQQYSEKGYGDLHFHDRLLDSRGNTMGYYLKKCLPPPK